MANSSMVAVRLFREHDLAKDWSEIPVEAYFPVFLQDEKSIAENVSGRVKTAYSKHDEVKKIRWNYWGDDSNGFWIQ